MTIWTPYLSSDETSKYRAIAEAIANDIAKGVLKPGDQLPTLRNVARQLGVTVGTVGRAYAIAQRQSLIKTEVGRGTFVTRVEEDQTAGIPGSRPRTDLGLNRPPPLRATECFEDEIASISRDPGLGALLDIGSIGGSESHRQAMAEWMSLRTPTDPSSVLIANGTQNALIIVLAALTKPGDTILVESLTFPGLLAAARLLHLTLQPVEIDEQGLVPESLDSVAGHSKVLYCVPTNHCAMATTQSASRRKRIAQIARRHQLTVIEDDVYGLLIQDAPAPLVEYLPDSGVLISSLSKTIAVGLRLAIVRFPSRMRQALLDNMRATEFFPAPLIVELAARMIRGGRAAECVSHCKESALARQTIAREVLCGEVSVMPAHGNHVWVSLPSHWGDKEFAVAAREQGIVVYPSSMFAAQSDLAPSGIRISLGSPRTESELRQSLIELMAIVKQDRHKPVVGY